MSNIPEAFKEWACSFSGCDGGNPQGSIWVSGIEWGFGKERKETPAEYEHRLEEYYKELGNEISKGSYSPSQKYDMKNELSYQFGQKLAKIYSAIKGLKTEAYKDVAQGCNGSEIFKLNIYPIAFPTEYDALWEKYGLPKITGLASKHIYRTWCFLHRFPFISEQVNEYKPKLIIATGITYLTDFVVCFAGTGGVEEIIKDTIASQPGADQSTRTFYWTKVNNITTLVVIPFLGGQSGLNSDYLLQRFGERIREIVSP